MHTIARCFLIAGLVGAAVPSLALAQDGHGAVDAGHADAAAGHGAAGEHAAAEAGHDAGGDHGGGHLSYTGDDDHDGTANWLDADAGEAYVASKLFFHAINFALFIGLLVWFFGPGVRASLKTRALGIRNDIDEAARLRADAKARHDAVTQRLAALEGEVAQLHATAKADGEAEERRIEARAAEAAARVAETARRQIRDEATRASQTLRREAVELAVELAEGILRGQVQAADQRRLAAEFLEVVRTHDAGGSDHV